MNSTRSSAAVTVSPATIRVAVSLDHVSAPKVAEAVQDLARLAGAGVTGQCRDDPPQHRHRLPSTRNPRAHGRATFKR